MHVERVEDLASILDRVATLTSGRGRPTLDLQRYDGSSLSLSSDGERAFLVWINSLGEPFHSVGGMPGPALVFDYMGSWSEAPGEVLIPYAEAVACAERFLREGVAATDSVLFEPE